MVKKGRSECVETYVSLFLGPKVEVEGTLAQSELLIKYVNGCACYQTLLVGFLHVIDGDSNERNSCQVTESDREYDLLPDIKRIMDAAVEEWVKSLAVQRELNNDEVLEVNVEWLIC